MATNDLVRLASAIRRYAKQDGIFRTSISGLDLYRCSEPSNLTAIVYEPSLCVVAQGAKEVILAGDSYCYDPERFLLVSVDLPVSSRVVDASPNRPCLMVRISLDPVMIAELVAAVTTEPQPGPPTRGLALSIVEPPLLDAVIRLVSLLDTPQDIGPLAPLIQREIIYRVITSPQGRHLRQSVMAGVPTQRIAQVINRIRKEYAEPLRIESLASQVSMSVSAFHLHFKKVTGYSPLNFQKQLRLQEARQLMIGEGLDAAEAAFRVGYESPSQFGREYRRLFGNSPRRDVTSVKMK